MATGSRTKTTPPSVVLRDGDDASGMAYMLGGLLEDNLRDFPSRARVARVLRGPVVMTASDRDMSVTIEFMRGQIELRDGADVGATVISGPWLAMTKLCSGQKSPVAAFREGDVRITRYRGAPIAAGAGFVLSVPTSFYEEELARREGPRVEGPRGNGPRGDIAGGIGAPTANPTSPTADTTRLLADPPSPTADTTRLLTDPPSPLADPRVRATLAALLLIVIAYALYRCRRMTMVDAAIDQPGELHAASRKGRHRPSRGRAS